MRAMRRYGYLSLNAILLEVFRKKVGIELSKGATMTVTLDGNCARGDERQEAEAYITKLKENGLVMGKGGLLVINVKHKVFEYNRVELNEKDT